MSFRKVDSKHFRDVYVAEMSYAGYENSNHIAQQIEKELYRHSTMSSMMRKHGNEPILVVVVKNNSLGGGLLSSSYYQEERARQEALYHSQMHKPYSPPMELDSKTTAQESKPNNILLLT